MQLSRKQIAPPRIRGLEHRDFFFFSCSIVTELNSLFHSHELQINIDSLMLIEEKNKAEISSDRPEHQKKRPNEKMII